MRAMRHVVRMTVLALTLAAAGTAAAVESAGDAGKAVYVQFRELFDRRGKPTERARALDGRVIEMIGFSTAPPTRESPFLVFVGAPTAHCPYCTAVSEMDHLPYVLIYAEHDLETYGRRDRLRVRGRLKVAHEHEEMYGLHVDLRLLGSTVRRDVRATNPARPVQVRNRAAAPGEVLDRPAEGKPGPDAPTAETVD